MRKYVRPLLANSIENPKNTSKTLAVAPMKDTEITLTKDDIDMGGIIGKGSSETK